MASYNVRLDELNAEVVDDTKSREEAEESKNVVDE